MISKKEICSHFNIAIEAGSHLGHLHHPLVVFALHLDVSLLVNLIQVFGGIVAIHKVSPNDLVVDLSSNLQFPLCHLKQFLASLEVSWFVGQVILDDDMSANLHVK